MLSFKAAFDGATFADARGKPQPCSVEYAPFQRVPRGRVKRDPREGTIEKGKQPAVAISLQTSANKCKQLRNCMCMVTLAGFYS